MHLLFVEHAELNIKGKKLAIASTTTIALIGFEKSTKIILINWMMHSMHCIGHIKYINMRFSFLYAKLRRVKKTDVHDFSREKDKICRHFDTWNICPSFLSLPALFPSFAALLAKHAWAINTFSLRNKSVLSDGSVQNKLRFNRKKTLHSVHRLNSMERKNKF